MFSFLFGRSSSKRSKCQVVRKSDRRFEGLEDRSVPATFVVTNSGDEGPGTLREVVAQANASAGADVIEIKVNEASLQIPLQHGEIAVTDDLSIVGEGMDKTVISGSRLSRIFNVEGPGDVTLKLQDLTLFQGAAQGDGGAVRVAGGRLEARSVDFLQNQAEKGGAVAVVDRAGIAGEAFFDGVIFNRNTATNKGGALYVDSALAPPAGAHAVVGASNFAFNAVNAPTGGGGGIAIESGVLNVTASSFVLNTSQGSGGGIEAGVNADVNIIASTLHQNSSSAGSGGAGILARGDLLISNSTITGNSDTSAQSAGGIRMIGPDKMLLSSSIVAENTGLSAGLSPDIRTDAAVISDGHNLIGKAAGVNGLMNSDLTGVDPMLGPALYNGGITASRVPLTGSPVIGMGSNPYGAAFDQRGSGYDRATQGKVDIGAVQYDASNAAPGAEIVHAPAVTIESSATSYDFIVKYTDESAVSAGTLDSNDVIVTGPNGVNYKASLIMTDSEVNGPAVQAQYRITPPGGTWTPLLNGTYTITLNQNQVFDAEGRPTAGKTLATFEVTMTGDTAGYVQSVYKTVLGRAADAAGLQAYMDRINGGESRESVAKEIWDSWEHRRNQVVAYYRGILNRDPDQQGLEYWSEQLKNGASEEEVTSSLLASEEYLQGKPAGATLTNNFYRSLFGRQADAGAADYSSKLESGTRAAKDVAKELTTSSERIDADVDNLYQQVLLRQPDEEGRTEWSKKVRDGAGIGDAAVAMLASDEFFKLHGGKL